MARTFYIANGGTCTGANYLQADGSSHPTKFLSVETHNDITVGNYLAGDTFIIDGQHGIIRINVADGGEALQPRGASGTQDEPITYLGINGVELCAATQLTGWTNSAANVWWAALSLAADPLQVFFGDTRGHKVATQAEVDDAEFNWWFDNPNNKLYVYSTADPTTTYAPRGIEVNDSNSRNNCLTYGAGAKNWHRFSNIKFSRSKEYPFNVFNLNLDGLEVDHCTFSQAWYAGSRVTGDEAGAGLTHVYFHDNIAEYNGGHGTVFSGKQVNSVQRRDIARYNCHYVSQPGAPSQHNNVANLKLAGSYNDGFIIEQCVAQHANTTHRTPVENKGNGIWCDVVVDNAKIQHNYTHDNGNEGIRIEESNNCKVTYNLSVDNAGTQIHVCGNDVTQRAATGNKVYGNVCYGGNISLECNANFASGVVDNDFANNVCAGWAYRAISAYGGGDNAGGEGSGNIYRYNSVGVADTGYLRWGATYYDTLAAWEAVTSGASADNIDGDALMSAPASGDFWLTDVSPCKDAGLDLGSPYNYGLDLTSVWTNYVVAVNQDEYGSGWDVGAYVFTEVDPDEPPVSIDFNLTGVLIMKKLYKK